MNDTYQQLLATLNPEQLQAVQTTEGPVMVIAGPGTGKTHVLTLRIANILRTTDTPASGILALTFTETAAENMRKRLLPLLGNDAYYVTISTFHGFCHSVVSAHPEYFPIQRELKIVSELEQLQLIRELLAEGSFEQLKPLLRFDYWAKALKSHISELKREGISPEMYAEAVYSADAGLQDNLSKSAQEKAKRVAGQLRDIATMYSSYEQRLQSAGNYDYDDLIMRVKDAFTQHENLRLDYEEHFLYFLVDEYQDTNSAQNAIVKLLSSVWGEQANVFVVGDPHQSIFRFQGASLRNTIEFTQWFPEATIITLKTGYRCPTSIYQLAHFSIMQSKMMASTKDNQYSGALYTALSTPLSSTKVHENAVTFTTAQDASHQNLAIASAVQTLLSEGVHPSQIAVLVKENRQANKIGESLAQLGIEHKSTAPEDILKNTAVKQCIQYAKLCLYLRDGTETSELLFEVLAYPWLVNNNLALFASARAAGQARITLWEQLMKHEPAEGVGQAELLAMRKIIEVMQQLSVVETQLDGIEWWQMVLKESGLLAYVLDASHITNLTDHVFALKELIVFLKTIRSNSGETWHGGEALSLLETIKEQALSIPSAQPENADAVTISTVHRAKGMEWQHVFVPFLVDKKWGNGALRVGLPLPESLQPDTSEDLDPKEKKNEDERRLFYVAITRASQHLHLFGYQFDDEQRPPRQVLPSLFVDELLSGDTKKMITCDKSPVSELQAATAQLTPPGPRASQGEAQLERYLTELLEHYPLSITALNAYLSDPGQFLVMNLLHIPSEKKPALVKGTAVHQALHSLVTQRMQGNSNVDSIVDALTSQIHSELRGTKEAGGIVQDGCHIVTAYAQATASDSLDLVYALEYGIGSGKHTAVLDGIPLKGRLDRLDYATKEKKELLVIDYKTGRDRSEAVIKAETATARLKLSQRELALPEALWGSYYRQLLFYVVLAELDRATPLAITQGVFDFVEVPKESNKVSRRFFSLPQTDVELMKLVIIDTMKEIKSLAFLSEVLEKNQLIQSYASLSLEELLPYSE